MKARNVTQAQIEAAASDAGVSVDDLCVRGRDLQFKIGLAPDRRYQRTGLTGHRINAVCYHGYGAFFTALYGIAPEAVVSTGMARLSGPEDVRLALVDLAERTIGRPGSGLRYADACRC